MRENLQPDFSLYFRGFFSTIKSVTKADTDGRKTVFVFAAVSVGAALQYLMQIPAEKSQQRRIKT